MHRAVLSNNFDCLFKLLEARVCNINHRSKEGKLASQYAVQYPFLSKMLRKAELF